MLGFPFSPPSAPFPPKARGRWGSHAEIDHRADIYALGVIIYQMIAGRLPRGLWKPASQQSGWHPQWDDIVDHAMQCDPVDRYQSATVIKADLSWMGSAASRVAADSGPAANGPAIPTPAPVRPATAKSRAPLIFGLLAGILVLALGAFFVLESLRSSSDAVVFKDTTPPSPGLSVSASSVTPDASTSSAHTFGGHRYEFLAGNFTWDEARAKAGEMGGHLAAVTSEAEAAWIYTIFESLFDQDHRSSSIWLGATTNGKEQTWK